MSRLIVSVLLVAALFATAHAADVEAEATMQRTFSITPRIMMCTFGG